MTIRLKVYLFSSVAMLSLACLGALGLLAGYLADQQIAAQQQVHGPALQRLAELATGLGTLEPHSGHTPAAGQWAALEQRLHAGSQAALPTLADDWRTLDQHWQSWRNTPADDLAGQTGAHQRVVAALDQLAQHSREAIQREQHSQEQHRQQLFQLILWGGAALSVGMLLLARYIIGSIVRPLRMLCATASDTRQDLDLTRRCQWQVTMRSLAALRHSMRYWMPFARVFIGSTPKAARWTIPPKKWLALHSRLPLLPKRKANPP